MDSKSRIAASWLSRTSRFSTSTPSPRATVSTSFNEPYNVARIFASIDHISQGRAAWNVVTSSQPRAALNFSRDAHMEHELRYDLWMLRDAIDRYKDAADRGAFQIKVGTDGYPPDLDTLVNGVDVAGKKLRFLRKIPVDPMTGKAEWGMRSMQDEPDSDSWGGQDVFDVFTKSQGTGLDGTKYREW